METDKKLQDEVIEKFILDNIDGFESLAITNNFARFKNAEIGLVLQPNIEELESVISSNYDSSLVWVFGSDMPTIAISSAKIVDKLKEKISGTIESELERKRVESLPPEQKEQYCKEQFIKKYIKIGRG